MKSKLFSKSRSVKVIRKQYQIIYLCLLAASLIGYALVCDIAFKRGRASAPAYQVWNPDAKSWTDIQIVSGFTDTMQKHELYCGHVACSLYKIDPKDGALILLPAIHPQDSVNDEQPLQQLLPRASN